MPVDIDWRSSFPVHQSTRPPATIRPRDPSPCVSSANAPTFSKRASLTLSCAS